MMKTTCVAMMVATAVLVAGAGGQEPTRAVPGNGVLDLTRLEPFEAEYDQFGATIQVRLAQVGFGAFRDEYLEASDADGVLRLRRLVRGEDDVPTYSEEAHADPLVDGTFLFWALGLLPPTEGQAFTFPTWSPTAEGTTTRESAALMAVGTEQFDAGAGGTVQATVFEAEAGDSRLRMLVVPHAPYLLRQEAVDAAGDTTVVLELRSMRRPLVQADARREINANARRFSRAYVEGDVDEVRSLYTEDGRLLPPGRVVQGREAIGRYFSPNPRVTTLAHRMAADSRTIREDQAIEVGRWHQLARNETSGEIFRSSERYLIVWRRQLDGGWRIAEDVWHRPGPTAEAELVHRALRRPVDGGTPSIRVGDDAPDARQGASEIDSDDDLSLTFTPGWDSEAFTLRVHWRDDVVDQTMIGSEQGLWTRPDGEVRDRMYFYDSLQLRFWLGDRFVGVWLAPREGQALQWARVDPTDGESRFVDVDAEGVIVEGGVVLDVRVPWSILGVEPRPGMALDIQLVAPDSDHPAWSLEEKETVIDWRAWRAPIVLAER